MKEAAHDAWQEYDPDMILIEQKGSGMPLTQELRRMGIPVTPFTPGRADKFTRMRVHLCLKVYGLGT